MAAAASVPHTPQSGSKGKGREREKLANSFGDTGEATRQNRCYFDVSLTRNSPRDRVSLRMDGSSLSGDFFLKRTFARHFKRQERNTREFSLSLSPSPSSILLFACLFIERKVVFYSR